MLKRELGPARVPVIGQGTWRLRGPEAVDALRTGIELGLTHIDTAELYGTEEMVAEAIEGQRDEIFLVSKVLPSNATRKGTVAAVAAELHATRRQVALAFLVRLPGTFAIPKASTVEHVRENAGGASVKLTERQIARLERAYPVHVRSELPTS